MRDSIIKIVRRHTETGKRIFRFYLIFLSILITVVFIWGLTNVKRDIRIDKRIIEDFENKSIEEHFQEIDGICGIDISQYKIEPTKIVFENGEYIYRYPDKKIAHLTIVPEMQNILKKNLETYSLPFAGAIVLDASTGKILAMYEKRRDSRYSIFRTYKAASVFKIITMESLLSEKNINTDEQMCYYGGKRSIERRHLIENPKKDHKCLNINKALGHSANVIFARLAYRYLDREILRNHTTNFGFFESIPVEFEVERSNINIPSEREELAYTAAGFGETYISVLHGAIIASIVANNGIYVKPSIIEQIEDDEQNILYQHIRTEFKEVFSKDVANRLKEMMRYTITEGTAHKFFAKRRPVDFIREIPVAGKTGSIADKGSNYTEYNWFVGFAPVDNPKYVISVITINSENISARATLYAKNILNDLFKIKTTKYKLSDGKSGEILGIR
ncbi:MAG: penicillin-binding transpeptidase domain-containing protein [Myxococcota bacterium]